MNEKYKECGNKKKRKNKEAKIRKQKGREKGSKM